MVRYDSGLNGSCRVRGVKRTSSGYPAISRSRCAVFGGSYYDSFVINNGQSWTSELCTIWLT